MTEQFDEGVKEILLVLLNLGAGLYETNYILSLLKDRPEPIEQKIEGLKQAEDKINSLKFDKAAQQAVQRLSEVKPETPKQTNLQKVYVKPRVSMPRVSENDYLDIATKLIIPSEIHGVDLNAPENKKFHRPHLDDKGLWTIGIGHLMGDGSTAGKNAWISKHGSRLSTSQVMKLFKQDLEKHTKRAEQAVGSDVFNKLSAHRKAALVDISYRGDLKPEFDFVRFIRQGKFNKAAIAYLDHAEYKERIKAKKGSLDGVVKRMNRNANILRGLS